MRIILDTNKWYDIAEGKHPYKEIKALPLCLTTWNVLELIANPKLLIPEIETEKTEKERAIALQTCKIILELNPELIPYLPYDYLAKEVLEINCPETQFGKEIIKGFLNDNFSQDDIRDFIEVKNIAIQAFKSSMDEQKDEQKKVKKVNLKLARKSNPDAPENLLSKVYCRTIKNIQIQLKISDSMLNSIVGKVNLEKNANKITFFLKGLESFNIWLCLRNNKAKKTDQFDLLNMVYVGINDKYWCRDKEWHKKIRWDGIENFLFKLPSYKN